MTEFTQQYISTKNQLIERELEIKQNILTNNERLKQAKEALEQARRIHGNYVTGPMGILNVQVIRAENLGNANNSHVILNQGNKQ